MRSYIHVAFWISLTEQRHCGVDNLPPYGDQRRSSDPEFLGKPPDDRLQALVPAYTFNCTGRVTEWKACVEQGGEKERYYIQFQIWRPTGVTGCYQLVGYNEPFGSSFQDIETLLQPFHHCVELVVRENEQIDFHPGDIIGFYTDRLKKDKNPNDGGIQVVGDQHAVMYHEVDVEISDLKTQYAIPALGAEPSACGFQVAATSYLHQLTQTTRGVPVISASFSAGIYYSVIKFLVTVNLEIEMTVKVFVIAKFYIKLCLPKCAS